MAIQLLKNILFFRKLPCKDLRRILGIAKVETYQKGEIIFRQEETGSHLFVVCSGRVKIFFTSTGERRKTLAHLKTGEFFGEMALLDGKVRSANAMAMKPTRILVIHKKDFKQLLAKDHSLMFLVLRTLSERLRRADEQIKSLIFKNVHGRVVKTLVDMAREGRREDEGIVLSQPMSRQDLAEIVGTTREPITRSLGMLKRAGLIEYRDRDIFIKDLERMKGLV